MVDLKIINEFDVLHETRESIVHLLIQLETGPAPAARPRRPFNIALVLDRSGSMGGAKIQHTRAAAEHFISQLKREDRISIVSYDDRIEVHCAGLPGHRKDQLRRALAAIAPRGMTNLSGGWLAGVAEVEKGLAEAGHGRLNRVLLMTDGLANAGITEVDSLVALGRKSLERGVRTTTLGFGSDFNEDLLMKVADESGGNFYYIDSPEKAPVAFLEELGEMSAVVGQNLEVFLRCEDGVAIDTNFSNLPGEKSAGSLSWRMGDLYADDLRQVLLSLRVPSKLARGHAPIAQVGVRYQSAEDGALKRHEAPVTAVFSDAGARDRSINETVLQELLLMRSARAKEQAAVHADRGDFSAARQVLSAGVEAIRACVAAPPATMGAAALDALEAEACEAEAFAGQLQNRQFTASDRKVMLTQAFQAKNQRGNYRKK